MNKYIVSPAIALALTLAGCDSTVTTQQIKQLEISIQTATTAACQVAPTVQSIGIIVASLIEGGTAIDLVANQVVNQFCAVVKTTPLVGGALGGKVGEAAPVGEYKGYILYGVRK